MGHRGGGKEEEEEEKGCEERYREMTRDDGLRDRKRRGHVGKCDNGCGRRKNCDVQWREERVKCDEFM